MLSRKVAVITGSGRGRLARPFQDKHLPQNP